MDCGKCKDEKVIWENDRHGIMKCIPCPECNFQGRRVQAEQRKLEREKAYGRA